MTERGGASYVPRSTQGSRLFETSNSSVTVSVTKCSASASEVSGVVHAPFPQHKRSETDEALRTKQPSGTYEKDYEENQVGADSLRLSPE
jgi:hypothetical protein